MTKYTPGPWKINRTITHNYIGAGEQDRVTGHSYQCVAYNVVDEADARLIAAAPDLLAACKTALRYLTVQIPYSPSEQGDSNFVPAVQALRAAIAKATSSTD